MDVVRRDVVPVGAAFALFLVMVATWWRHPAPLPGPPAGSSDRSRAMALLGVTVGGGYVAFLAIVLVFHVLIARQAGAFKSAATGGAFLAFGTALPAFTLLSWAHERWRRSKR